MKKMIIGVIIGMIATIAIESIAALIYAKFFMTIPDEDGIVIMQNVKDNDEKVKFKGMTEKEWEEKIAKYEICDVKMVDCHYEDGKLDLAGYKKIVQDISAY